jgi:hypothetical protein
VREGELLVAIALHACVLGSEWTPVASFLEAKQQDLSAGQLDLYS